MNKKIRVGIIFGGKSAEHEISLRSAKNIIDAIDTSVYDVVPIAIGKDGRWLIGSHSKALIDDQDPKHMVVNSSVGERVALVPQSDGKLSMLEQTSSGQAIDVAFPILHGPFGEDGTIQGLLKLANIPFVGAGVLGSAVGMDKDVMKRLLRDAGIPIGRFITAKKKEIPTYEVVTSMLGTPVFVKPANLGSSVGVSKVTNAQNFMEAIEEAFKYDTKIIIEENIPGREIECAVLGNDEPIASVPGEVVIHSDFYSYEAKYLSDTAATTHIPADLPPSVIEKIQELAIKTFQVLSCEGLGRVDFFLRPDGGIFVNEINTIPGFTSISMYPKLWEASGISYTDLISRLITLAIERFKEEQKLQTSRG